MQQFLDIRTLSFITGVSALAMFICMAHVALRHRTYPGFSHWGAAFLANCLGLLATSARSILPDTISIVLGNSLNLAAPILICRGLVRFSGARQANWLDIAGLLSLAGLLTCFTYLDNNMRQRTVFLAFWMAVFYLRAAWLARFPMARVLGGCNCLLAVSLASAGLWLVYYGVFYWFLQGAGNDMMRAGVTTGLNLVLWLFFTTAIMVGLISVNSKRLENDLLSAGEEIVELRSFLPICANCKKIRDDQGYWQQVEMYLEVHTGAETTHSICPDCAKKLYPELYPKGDET